MKIKSITLKNFRNHADTHIALDRLTVVKGPNGAGKSSVRQAVEVALTGRCEATDRAGRGLADLIRHGAKEAEIVLEIDGLGEVRRRIRRSGSSLQVADWSGSAKVQQELLFRELGTDADQVAALLNVSYFLDLPPKEQTDMLFRLVGAGLTKDYVIEALQASGADWPEDMGLPERPTADWFSRAFREVYERRREAKRTLERARGRLEGMKASRHNVEAGPADLPRIEEELRALEERRDEALRRRAEAAATRAGRAELEQGLRLKRKELAAKKQALAECEPTMDVSEAADRLDRARGEEARLRATSAALAEELRSIDEALAALKKASGRCPLAPKVVPCPLKGEKLKALEKELGSKRRKLVREHEAAIKRVGELAPEIRSLEEVVERERRRESLLSEIAQLEAEISGLEKELAALPGAEDPRAEEEDPKTLEEKIRGLMELAAGLRALEKAEAERSHLSEEVARLEAEVENLETLAALLGPGKDGIRTSFLRRALGELYRHISANLEDLMPGVGLDLDMEPEFHLALQGLEVRQLSTSERMRLGIAVSEALARLSGLRLLVIDDIEVLDAENRALLSAFLLSSAAEFDTVIAISVADEAEEAKAEGVSVWWVQDGKAQRVQGRVKAA